MPNVRRDQSDDVIVNDLLVHVIGVTFVCRKTINMHFCRLGCGNCRLLRSLKG